MDELNYFINDQKFPKEISTALRAYFHQTREQQRLASYRKLLDMMSPMLKGEVAYLTHRTWLIKVYYFQVSGHMGVAWVAL